MVRVKSGSWSLRFVTGRPCTPSTSIIPAWDARPCYDEARSLIYLECHKSSPALYNLLLACSNDQSSFNPRATLRVKLDHVELEEPQSSPIKVVDPSVELGVVGLLCQQRSNAVGVSQALSSVGATV